MLKHPFTVIVREWHWYLFIHWHCHGQTVTLSLLLSDCDTIIVREWPWYLFIHWHCHGQTVTLSLLLSDCDTVIVREGHCHCHCHWQTVCFAITTTQLERRSVKCYHAVHPSQKFLFVVFPSLQHQDGCQRVAVHTYGGFIMLPHWNVRPQTLWLNIADSRIILRLC